MQVCSHIETMFGRLTDFHRIATHYAPECNGSLLLAFAATLIFWLESMIPEPRAQARSQPEGESGGERYA
jgi:hypothetical protein